MTVNKYVKDYRLIESFDEVLGLDLLAKADAARKAKATAAATGSEEYSVTAPADADPALAAQMHDLLMKRYEARKAKNWAESDRLRDAIAAAGWTVKDSKTGQSVTRR